MFRSGTTPISIFRRIITVIWRHKLQNHQQPKFNHCRNVKLMLSISWIFGSNLYSAPLKYFLFSTMVLCAVLRLHEDFLSRMFNTVAQSASLDLLHLSEHRFWTQPLKAPNSTIYFFSICNFKFWQLAFRAKILVFSLLVVVHKEIGSHF